MARYEPIIASTVTVALSLLLVSTAFAQESAEPPETSTADPGQTMLDSRKSPLSDGVWLSAGVGFERFDTNFTFVDKALASDR